MVLNDNSPAGFVDSLVKRVTGILQGSWWEGAEFADDAFHTPIVHAQFIPVSLTANADRDPAKDFPLVQIFCGNGEVVEWNNNGLPSHLNVKIICGGYRDNPDNQGWRIPTNMAWAIIHDLMEDRQQEGYQLMTPIKWSMVEDYEPPYWATAIDTIWEGGPPAFTILGRESRDGILSEVTKMDFSETTESGGV